jgi:hypothetical protein
MRSILIAAFTLLSGAASAQDITIPRGIEELAGRAAETVNVTVDGPLLQLAGKFLSSTDADQKRVKDLISNLKGIYVRSFEFDKPGQYSEADVESVRSQLRAPTWSKMVTVRNKTGDNVDVFFKMEEGAVAGIKDKIAGLVVIAAEPNELTFVNIVGPINLEQLSSLGGQFGIPKVDVGRGAAPGTEK